MKQNAKKTKQSKMQLNITQNNTPKINKNTMKRNTRVKGTKVLLE